MVLSKALQRFIASGGKIKNLKPQKAPNFAKAEIESQERGIKTFVAKFGDKPQYMGFSEASGIKLAGEELAGKTSRKVFIKKFTKDLSRSRTITAIGIKGTKGLKKKVIPTWKVATHRYTTSEVHGKSIPYGRLKQSGTTVQRKPQIITSRKLRSAKSKGALKAFETARVKEDKVFIKTLSKFTGSSKKPHFKTFWKKLDKPIKW